MKRRGAQQDENLDSLLDTMANVVGILVVLVAVTQLSVGGAVERIREREATESASLETVEDAELRLREVEEAISSAGEEWRALENTARQRGWLLDRADPILDEFEALRGEYDLAGGQEERAQQDAALVAREVEALESEVEQSRSRLSALDRVLRDVPAEARPKVARLPDPRPAPPGAKRRIFFCRDGRVLPVELDDLWDDMMEGVRAAIGASGREEQTILKPGDVDYIVHFFSKTQIGSDGFYWAFLPPRDRQSFEVRLVWEERNRGETLADLRLGDSAYEAYLRSLDRRKHYAYFVVWPDSYEVYLEARYLAERAGLPAGWLPFEPEREVTIDILGAGTARPLQVD